MTNPAYEATNSDVALSELSGVALDWVVAQIIKLPVEYESDNGCLWFERSSEWNIWTPSTDWSQCGPLMDEGCKSFGLVQDGHGKTWRSFAYGKKFHGEDTMRMASGFNIKQAFCRAMVREKYGDTVAIPREILEASNG